MCLYFAHSALLFIIYLIGDPGEKCDVLILVTHESA